ncbi:hypothetical protein ITP53_08715 [Nonomuraea sp. K274]|uniref:Uncharacterized protein n=1 Tax=Nonomuraea cypriaca TaxID=1187855 RepID=A0A931AAK8_9ACTN|nr:hypothetical protein [Nonomuraea cypriaca]MBF8185822.1 hypothetical protein [Nonomuraea cypriaca]
MPSGTASLAPRHGRLPGGWPCPALPAAGQSQDPHQQPSDLDVCKGKGKVTYGRGKGSPPGFNAVSFQSLDGSVQFVISATLATSNRDTALDPLLKKAGEAVLCPGK